MTINLPAELESAAQAQARTRGVTLDRYVRELIEQNLPASTDRGSQLPLRTGLGMWAAYKVDLSDEKIAQNRADMFWNFGEDAE